MRRPRALPVLAPCTPYATGVLAEPCPCGSIDRTAAGPLGRADCGCTFGGVRRALRMGAARCRLFCCMLGLEPSSEVLVSQCLFSGVASSSRTCCQKRNSLQWGPVYVCVPAVGVGSVLCFAISSHDSLSLFHVSADRLYCVYETEQLSCFLLMNCHDRKNAQQHLQVCSPYLSQHAVHGQSILQSFIRSLSACKI